MSVTKMQMSLMFLGARRSSLCRRLEGNLSLISSTAISMSFALSPILLFIFRQRMMKFSISSRFSFPVKYGTFLSMSLVSLSSSMLAMFVSGVKILGVVSVVLGRSSELLIISVSVVV